MENKDPMRRRSRIGLPEDALEDNVHRRISPGSPSKAVKKRFTEETLSDRENDTDRQTP